MIGTNDLKGFTISQLRIMYAEARGHCVAAGKFANAMAFDAHVSHFVDYEARGKIGIARSWVQCAFGQLGHIYNLNTSTPPSEETLAWGGFLDGEISWDTRVTESVIRQIMASASFPIVAP